MNQDYGSQNMTGHLRRVIVRRPHPAFAVSDTVRWHYTGRPDLEIALKEHDRFVELLHQAGTEVIYHEEPQPKNADAIYVHDPALVTDKGAILLRMGKLLRRGEEEAMGRRFESLHIPIFYKLHSNATAEGGDLLWIDHDTLAIGQGFRTNAEGLRQLTLAMRALEVTVISVPLPYFQGPDACLHLMSFISIVGEKIAVIYPPLMPIPFWQELHDRGFSLVEVVDEEFPTMAANVLSLTPTSCVMLAGNPITKKRLEEVGFKVLTYVGNEISLKAEGGPTCLTRPILRTG